MEGFFPTPKHYLDKDKTVLAVYRKRFVGEFKFTVDLSKVPGSPPLFEPELVEEDVGADAACAMSFQNTVIKFKILQRITTKK